MNENKNLERLTKAELIKQLEESESTIKELKAKEEARNKQIELDLSFGAEMTPEKEEHLKKQRRKDFIKRMTHGIWTSEEKYQEFMNNQQKQMRMS